MWLISDDPTTQLLHHLGRGEGRVWQSDKSVPRPRIEPRTPAQRSDTLPLDRQVTHLREWKSEEDLYKNLAKDLKDNSKKYVQNKSEDNAKKYVQNKSEDNAKKYVQNKSEDNAKKCAQNKSEDNAKKCAQNQSEDNAKKCAQNRSEEESWLDGWDEDKGNCYYCGTASSSKWHSECRKLFLGGIVAAFSCNFCKMKFKGKRSLTYHKMTHTGDGVICGFCGKLLFGKKSVNYHKQKHTNHRSHKCSICFKAYHSNHYLLEHMNIHTGQTQKYLCHTCGLLCSKTRYYTHIRMHSNVKDYICDKCGKSFTRYNKLNSHLISHSSDINYNCAVCNKGTKTRTLLMHHIKTKHPQTMGLPETLGWPQKFPCSICNKKLSSKNTLTMHMQMHRGEKNHQCKICSKRLSTKTGLNMHMQMHKGEKNHQCTICGKKFLHKLYLMKHSISHTRERNYKCDLCDKTYMYPNDLAKHKLSVHSKKKTKKKNKHCSLASLKL
uniref:C2H2-type domain-containing protein n=1 Tax=Timema genevievae TaxID=629358 RepID=A0A7R9K7E7_TIMGE|nr:unnamed protein product [Timema genevievae]